MTQNQSPPKGDRAPVGWLIDDHLVRDKEVAEYWAKFKGIAPIPVVAEEDQPFTHQHVKRGTLYRVIGEGKLQVSPGRVLKDDEPLAIYQGHDGNLCVCPTDEFNEGRFIPAPTAAKAKDTRSVAEISETIVKMVKVAREVRLMALTECLEIAQRHGAFQTTISIKALITSLDQQGGSDAKE